jgi:CRP/FNR family transcriptional regulator, nitrogen oxide reductase regulator
MDNAAPGSCASAAPVLTGGAHLEQDAPDAWSADDRSFAEFGSRGRASHWGSAVLRIARGGARAGGRACAAVEGRQGETLFRQGAAAEAFHLIIGGRLKVSQTTSEGQQVIIRYLGPREVAGCVAVCGGIPYPATAEAVEDTWMLSWTRPCIAELADRHPGIAMAAMRIMGGRMTELQERLREMQTEQVERRIAHALGRLVVQAGRRTRDGIEIDFPITRQDLAEMTGTTLHTVSRTLSKGGIILDVAGGRG